MSRTKWRDRRAVFKKENSIPDTSKRIKTIVYYSSFPIHFCFIFSIIRKENGSLINSIIECKDVCINALGAVQCMYVGTCLFFKQNDAIWSLHVFTTVAILWYSPASSDGWIAVEDRTKSHRRTHIPITHPPGPERRLVPVLSVWWQHRTDSAVPPRWQAWLSELRAISGPLREMGHNTAEKKGKAASDRLNYATFVEVMNIKAESLGPGNSFHMFLARCNLHFTAGLLVGCTVQVRLVTW